jgi:2-haloacid dehalogenase
MPLVVAFDVNETLSDMSPMAARFTEVGAPAQLAGTWFAAVLRDGFALMAAGRSKPFSDVAADDLRVLLHGVRLDRALDAAVEHVMHGFSSLSVHPDVVAGVEQMGELGLRLVTLSNGSAQVAAGLLERAGIADRFERLLSVEQAGQWKPAPSSYAYAARECAVEPARMMLVAVHAWDIDGAHRAGLSTAWIDRTGAPYPAVFSPPAVQAASLVDLAAHLATRRSP